jgi:hypothetical protein
MGAWYFVGHHLGGTSDWPIVQQSEITVIHTTIYPIPIL